MSARIRVSSLASSLLFFMLLSVVAAPVRGEKLLRWKFEKGDQRTLTMAQNMKIAMTKNQQTSNASLNQTLVLRQLVADVDEQGNATIEHQFERIQMNVEGAPAASFVYDSAAPDQARGNIKEIAPILKTLAKSEFKTTVSPKGKILDVELPQEFVAMVERSPNVKPSLFAFYSKEGFKQLMKDSAAVFPDGPVAKDDMWTDKIETEDPLLGKQIVATTYTYEGEEDNAGKPVDRIDLAVSIEFAPKGQPGTPQVTPKDQKSTGALWFDAEAGQLVRGTMSQKMNMEVQDGTNKVETEITGQLEITVTTEM